MTAQYPLVSVIIPVYNMAEFIGETGDFDLNFLTDEIGAYEQNFYISEYE